MDGPDNRALTGNMSSRGRQTWPREVQVVWSRGRMRKWRGEDVRGTGERGSGQGKREMKSVASNLKAFEDEMRGLRGS